jgi:hypothetical protein
LPVSSVRWSAPFSLHKNLSLPTPRHLVRKHGGQKVLLLCAGPDERELSIFKLLLKSGICGENWDLVNGAQFDLTDDATWDPLVARVRSREFVAAFASPPCTTASRLRNKPGGPPPLRGLAGKDRYGLSGLSVPNKEKVRVHNLILLRVAEILKIMAQQGVPWLFETPALKDGEVSILRLDEYQSLLCTQGVQHVIGVQCPFGALSSKPTSWVSHQVDMTDMPRECTHGKRTWFNDRTGVAVSARHRPTAGTDTYSSSQLVKSARGTFVPTSFVSATLAAYPDLLNRFLVAKLCSALAASTVQPFRQSPVLLPVAPRNFSETIEWRQRLRGTVEIDDKSKADLLAIGGLRNAAESVSRLFTVQEFGSSMGNDLRALLLANYASSTPAGSWIDLTCDLIGTTDKDVRPPLDAIEAVKAVIMQCSGADTSCGPGTLTRINSSLLGAWRKASGDPETQVEIWLNQGAPAGILNQPLDVGIFPDCSADAELSLDSLSLDWRSFVNYSGVEQHEVTEAELMQHIAKGHIAAFNNIDELHRYVKGDPVLSKLGLILKTRNNITKARMILDTKASGIKYVTGKSQRVILPRLFDAVLRMLCLLSLTDTSGGSLSAFVLDFSDAFWQIPIAADELRFFCATSVIKGVRKYMSFLRAAQGSRAAPLLWARLAALLMRLTQSLFEPENVSLLCFVDDPIAALRGTELEKRTSVALIILVWEALGFKLAYHKGQFAKVVTWIGGTLSCETKGVRARVKDAIVADVRTDLKRILGQNVVSHKELHSLVGKLSHCAGLLIVLRPFLQPLWAALYSDVSGAPPNTVWTKQLAPTLSWIDTFFDGAVGGIERYFSVDSYLRRGPVVEIGTDASPWGMGGWLSVDGAITHFFACAVTSQDEAIYGHAIGSSSGQQVWECLAVLIGVCIWCDQWKHERINLKVRGDNVGALTLLIKLRPSSAAQAIVARELALHLIEVSFPPEAVHTPGVSHIIADRLSRVFAPGGSHVVDAGVHPALASALRTTVPDRPRQWYRSLTS